MSIFVIITIAVGLSMDAFSLSLIYGTLNMNSKIKKWMIAMVGIFHFFMPIIGYKVGKSILEIIRFNPDTLVGTIFLFLSIEMFLSIKNDEKVKIIHSILSTVLFAFTVSIDSFSIGVSFGVLKDRIIFPSIIFAISSAVFTYLGLRLGKKLSDKFGKIATLIGASILLILALFHFI